jgi:predicted transposase YbfD/YdcC
LENRNLWSELKCIGAICSETTKNGKTTVEWSYYITSKNMSADQLLHYARAHWGVESLHWLLDVHFDEDRSLSNKKTVLENLNVIRKMALNLARRFRDALAPKQSISGVMANALFRFDSLVIVTDFSKSE